ncbi:MAG: glycoside hydrolase family 43 protein [Oscillospiraceae bacterium]|jgi:arabinan endo-1,5-alpha-L-arabinosidase|nr:glycoside hydrolase family 43 protein [Oscillospiraceae bacterium]
MKRFRYFLPLFLLVLGFCPALGAAEGMPEKPTYRNVAVHDPSIIRAEDGAYYIYGSHMTCARSEDLMRWQLLSSNAEGGCTLVEDVQNQMREALTYAKTSTFWAPDVQQLRDGRYYMYYCTCEGSSPLSALGLAVSDHPEGPYEDLGIFLKSGGADYDATQYPNAIDPHTFYDKDGQLWMVYGSYSGGIFILQMDDTTGLPLPDQGYGKKLLGANHARIEGPYILYSPDTDYYYLFLSFGGLNANDGYNIRVCRSKNPDGPYEDALGQPMIDCGGQPGTFFNDSDYEGYGVKLMGGYQFKTLAGENSQATTAYRSPGHNSAFYDAETGRYFLVFHTRFATMGESFSVRVHQMYMNAEGWPVVYPLRYSGEDHIAVPEDQQSGVYKVIFHRRDINKVEHVSVVCMLAADGTASGDAAGTWAVGEDGAFTAVLDGVPYTGVMQMGYDSVQKAWLPCFTALSADGAALWGEKATGQAEGLEN